MVATARPIASGNNMLYKQALAYKNLIKITKTQKKVKKKTLYVPRAIYDHYAHGRLALLGPKALGLQTVVRGHNDLDIALNT